ncbi:TPA: hypothetical protein N3202_004481 [Salmonella enterica subsp. enterica serovar Typhimurium str. D23580]|uniref:hypothetical protein n=1 Tax=Burkholderia vietnamiensis TaxID=60552 RepID=UPI001B938015|nr:hypothetical protein [Burkholderia vietnamiensis]MBR8087045.1 hypothetical protein [Burkholderia vietnamiensis]HCM7206548.1 hypothetical protein [Salmonella enterica subsp. enterica serovar Typhimurium str. D23580]
MKALKTALLVAFAAAAVLVTAERVYLVNAPSYPRFLATDLGNVGAARVAELRKTACKDDPIEVYAKNGFWVLRCGFAYYQGHTYISHSDPFAEYRKTFSG